MNNTFGKIAPVLINPKLLKKVAKLPEIPQTIIVKSPFTQEIDQLFANILSFLRRNWLFIIGMFCVFCYLYYCHKQYEQEKKIKEQSKIETKEDFINHGEYICENNGVQILQRPIPEAKINPINEEIRNIYLQKVNPYINNCAFTRLSRVKGNSGQFFDDRMSNVFARSKHGNSGIARQSDSSCLDSSCMNLDYNRRLGPNIRRGKYAYDCDTRYEAPIIRSISAKGDENLCSESEESMDYFY